MEFSLHLPQDINKHGTLWQMWSSFSQKLQYYHSTSLNQTPLMGATSVLLFAAHHQVTSICSSLKSYDMDLAKLNKVLQVVEQACLPHFILLFERFRYFSLKCDSPDNLNDFTAVLRKQAEMCEFGSEEDAIMADILYKLMKSETPGLHGYGEQSFAESGDNTYNDFVSNSAGSSVSRDKDFHFFNVYRDDRHHPQDINTSYTESGINIDSLSQSVFHVGGRCTESHSVNEGKMSKSSEKQKKRKRGKTKSNTARDLNTAHENCDISSTHSNEIDGDDDTGKKKPRSLSSDNVAGNTAMPKRFLCCFCDKAFFGERCLRNHLSSKHPYHAEFKCRICEHISASKEEYLAHYKSSHVTEKRKLIKKRVNLMKLKIRDEDREEGKKFYCSICRRGFPREGYLRLHLHYNHAKNFLCWSCGEGFQSVAEYKLHSERHVVVSKFTCDLCNRQNHSITRLIGHLKNHLISRNKCDICGIVFTRPESLAKHIERHKDEPAYRCNKCGKSFVMEARLLYHMRSHSGEKRFTCELCGKMYSQKMNLVHHKRWHTGERPFECDVCGKRARSAGDLNKHKRKHSDKRSYVCEVCGRGFNYSSALSKHRMGHTGKRAYSCEVCGRTFIYREGLRDHIKASRCPGRRSEAGYSRTPRATKLLQSGMLDSFAHVEPKPYVQVLPQSASVPSQRDVDTWQCMLRNNEADGGASVVLVPPFY